MTSSDVAENDLSGIVDLIEVIRIQNSGPSEAARAIRKKLKYGNAHRQLRALTILDGLMGNAGAQFTRAFADEPLLERLRILPRDDMVDPDVRTKCDTLFRQWAVEYKNSQGLTGIASLHKQLPKRARPQASQSKVVRDNEREAEQDNPFAEPEPEPQPHSAQHERKRSYSRPTDVDQSSSSSRRATVTSIPSFSYKKDKKKLKPFNLEKEKPQILQSIASANIASTDLMNGLKFVNRETHKVSEDREIMDRFERCKMLRRQILRYIQLVESDQWIGSLLSANDELVKALMSFEIMDKSIEDDSDSDTEASASGRRDSSARGMGGPMPALQQDFGALDISSVPAPPKPPRPNSSSAKKAAVHLPSSTQHRDALPPSDSEEEDDEDDPFGDRNAIGT